MSIIDRTRRTIRRSDEGDQSVVDVARVWLGSVPGGFGPGGAMRAVGLLLIAGGVVAGFVLGTVNPIVVESGYYRVEEFNWLLAGVIGGPLFVAGVICACLAAVRARLDA